MTANEPALRWDEGNLPYSSVYGDHYYSRHDGQAETAHVFLGGNDLPERWEAGGEFAIGELGFGTGLNLLETWRQWRRHRQPGARLQFTSVEAHPLARADAERALSRWPALADERAALLDVWGRLGNGVALDEQTVAQVQFGEAAAVLNCFPMCDAWYLDGFAPARNPDLWSAELLRQVARRTKPGGTFASYTAAGWVRRNLAAAGFAVEKRPGFGTKRDMIAGRLETEA